MLLSEVIKNLDGFPVEATIYASEPWTEGSEAVVAVEPEGGGVPREAAASNCKYFLEVAIARDFLDDWSLSEEARRGESRCQRVIRYAIYDA